MKGKLTRIVLGVLAGIVLVVMIAVIAAAVNLAMQPIKPNVAPDPHFNLVVQDAPKPEVWDITVAMKRIACEQTARFVMENMATTPSFPDKFALLNRSLEAIDASADGLYCEFGVFEGKTINHIASRTSHTIHGFDSFEGLPENWRTGYLKGTFKLDGLPEVAKNVELYKGWFNESLPGWAADHPGPMAFMHLDADLYSSTKTVFEILADRVVPGTVIQFDEYFNYPGWQEGEYRAFKEFVESRAIQFEYIGYCNTNEQVAVRIESVGAPGEK
ncbi:MAG TPA: TylF/MycF/NovP-related O-methyltransferase [Pirellulales bacterium]|nr:TylF/MycF/NovP-related O-methyltransferase [Pirellulales bacterium]